MQRVLFYLFFDVSGTVDDFVLHKLQALRSHADHIFVISNSSLDATNTARLASVADTVWTRKNVGYDVFAFRDAMADFGVDRLADYDELVMMNCTFFGPIGSFDPLFADADAREDVDFWGISDHGAVEPHPFMVADRLEPHIQSHWIGVRAAMFTSAAWHTYWAEMPDITSYVDSVNLHEGRFTDFFHSAGFRSYVAYPAVNYPSVHPLIENAVSVLRDGCPIVKRRSFFSDPLYVDRRAIDTRALLGWIEEQDFPVEMLLSNLARTSEPRILATNLGLLEVLPEVAPSTDDATDLLRVTVVAHVDVPSMLPELLDRVAHLPGECRLVVTVPHELAETEVREILSERAVEADLRRVDPRGADISALLVGCRDLIESDDIDLLVRLHTGVRSRRGDPNRLELFRHHLHDCLLFSPGYVTHVLDLFRTHSSLGMVIAPTMHVGQTLHGHAWKKLRPRAEQEADRLGITVPFDTHTPYAAYGSMFIARPVALRAFTRTPYDAEDFSSDARHQGSVLVRALERLLAYAALNEGLHVREVMPAAVAAVDYSFLEFKYQALASQLPDAYTERQMRFIAKNRSLAHRYNKLWRARGAEAIGRGIGRAPWRTRKKPTPSPKAHL